MSAVLLIGAATLPAQRTTAPGAPAAASPRPTVPASPAPTTPMRRDEADLDAATRIKDEALQRSQVMETAWYLTDVHGPRLTNSPGMHAAADWTVARLSGWGLPQVRKETWGTFGRGWVNERLSVHETLPAPARPLTAFARAWTPGTNGRVAGQAVLLNLESPADFEVWEGQLAGKVVLLRPPVDIRPLLTPLARRLSPQDLEDVQAQPIPPEPQAAPATATFNTQRMQFFAREGVLAVLEPGTGRSDRGAVLVLGSNANRDAKEPAVPPQLIVPTEQYNRLARLLQKNQPVSLELDVQNRFLDGTLDAYNIIAELPGAGRADEVVMLGAHFDSWHAGTGATDNAGSVAVMMEAMRILHTTRLPLRRTVRLALWTGEEQGLLGSRGYVRRHFGDRDTMTLQPGHDRLSVYFNLDNGTGAIRGVYLQGNEAVRPVFSAWMEPLRSLGMTTLSIRDTGSTDHIPFNEVGLPGFQFIQDPVEYSTLSHHTNMDTYDRLQREDLMKNAAIVATFVYHAANRDALLPREPLPAPRAKPAAVTSPVTRP
jgi:hypothetical protein